LSANQAIITQEYVQLLTERKLSEAERELGRIRGKANQSEWGRGYVRALEGLFITYKSNSDKYLHLLKIDLTRKTIEELKDEFLKHSTNELHADYDRGYFKALADYMEILEKMKPWKNLSQKN